MIPRKSRDTNKSKIALFIKQPCYAWCVNITNCIYYGLMCFQLILCVCYIFSHNCLMTSHELLMVFVLWLSHDFRMTFSLLSYDLWFFLSFSYVPLDFLMNFWWLSHDFLMNISWLYCEIFITLSLLFLGLSHYFLMTFKRLHCDYLMNFSGLSHNFFMNFSWFFLWLPS